MTKEMIPLMNMLEKCLSLGNNLHGLFFALLNDESIKKGFDP